jgi:hypothetical protein
MANRLPVPAAWKKALQARFSHSNPNPKPMASERNLRRRMCVGKCSHRTKVAAYAAQRGHFKTFGEILAVYLCRFCKGYHLGHACLAEKRTRRNFRELQPI